ncbi:M16 family metallopeptidase [Phocaeicola fibrisolvens]|uniref:M16 family metallopeptidase n=1 Tax=Phocaeicola fibrisolvens TaxID=2981793 RepID=UPI000822173E|nr:M16 family metallopeptidase [Phocaeicola fibrisolvens]MCU6776634.1 insulinase family protein [Phocaeicola fibrisolvens]SCG91132.1 Protease 3 precursor [uncultured Bacteroides sp.]
MRRIMRLAFVAIAGFACLPVAVRAQQMPPVPVDKEVRIGKLDNGLTYYIRHNEYPKNQVDFYIAQKVGSILEEDDQRGLAHFLEHMCFNGTKNFPGSSMIKWLESVGVKFGYNLNAYTSIDETVYRISSVPTERIGVQDSCLMILSDWADGLLLNGKDIDEERAVIHEEWRSQLPPNMRILEKLLPELYPDSRYGHRLPIGTMEVVDHFPHQALRDYYEKWYRPDLQGIVVVGDIDVDRIEGKIKELFSKIEKPVNPAERVYYPVADNEKPIVAFGSDKEQDKYVAQIMFKYDALPDSLKGTMADVTTAYLLDMAQMMLQIRLNELGQKADAPFAAASAFYGEFIMAKTKQAFQFAMLPKGNSFDEGLKAVYREALRAKRGGFTATEYARCRTEYLSQLEKAYNNRNQQENKTLAESYVRNFIDKKPIPGIETEYQMMSMIVNQIPVEAVNQVFSQIVSDKNLVVLGMMPAREGEACPKDEDILALLSQVEAENIAPYVDNVKDEPLVSELPAAGKVVKENMLSDFGAKEWILSNGAKVILKKTDFKADEISMMAVAKGGTSVYGNDKAADLMFMPAVLEQHGLGSFTNSELTKLMAGKQVSLKVSLDDYVRRLSGNTTPKDLKTYMEMIYMTFTGLTVTPDEFIAMQNLYKGVIQNQAQNPNFVFQKKVQEFLYSSPTKQVFGVSDIEKANREDILSIIREQLANAAEFTFVFSGNFDEAELKALVEQYIATLPSVKGKKQELKHNPAVEIKSGNEEKEFSLKMEVPQGSAAVIISGKMPYSFKNRLMASMSAQIISARLLSEVREKEGAVYSIYTQGSQDRLSEVSVVYQTIFQVKPEKKDRALEIIRSEFENLAKETPVEELDKVKEFMVKQITGDEQTNSYWCSMMAGNELLPSEVCVKAEQVIQSIAPKEISGYVNEVMKQNNYRVLVMVPESK